MKIIKEEEMKYFCGVCHTIYSKLTPTRKCIYCKNKLSKRNSGGSRGNNFCMKISFNVKKEI